MAKFKITLTMKIIGGYQDTRKNSEDFSITPYLAAVYVNEQEVKIIGVSVCWGFSSVFIALAKGLHKDYPRFRCLK